MRAALPLARRGYERKAVDALLVRASATLGEAAAQVPELAGLPTTPPPADPVTPREVAEARFPLVLRGYDLAAVDALLRRLADVLPPDRTWTAAPLSAPEVAGPALGLQLRGYDTAEVDAFFARAAHSLGPRVSEVPELGCFLAGDRVGEPLTARDVDGVQFRLRRRGYDVAQVDALLDRVAGLLRG